MIEFSAFADEVTTDFEKQVRFLASENIPAIEIRFVDNKNIIDLNINERKGAKEILDRYGIKVSAIGSPIGKIAVDKPFEPHFEKFKHSVELAHFFETKFIRVFSYYPPEGEKVEAHREEIMERLGRQAEYLEKTDIVMVHENEAHIYGHSAHNCVDIIEEVNSPSLKLAYDPANFVWGENLTDNVESCWPLMRPHVVHVHIKDWKLGSTELGSIPGEGDGQIGMLLARLAKENYEGFLTMEPHLKLGGQFGGETGPELFAKAITATKAICDKVGLKYA